LSRRNLLSALVAADAAVAAEPGDVRAQAPAEAAGAAGSAAVAMDETASSGDAPLAPGLRSAEAPK
jgi:hypothetical protein